MKNALGHGQNQGVKRHFKPISERMLSKVTLPTNGEGCWIWRAALDHRGYGRIGAGGAKAKALRAHRAMYELFIGPIPPGMTLDHLCKVPRCVNPAHLEPVTMRENILRSDNHAARCARRTACPKGHAYDDTNTLIYRNKRYCRACRGMRPAGWQRDYK